MVFNKIDYQKKKYKNKFETSMNKIKATFLVVTR